MPTSPSSKKARVTPKKSNAGRATSFDPQVAIAFGTVIRAARNRLEIAQDEFALRAHVDRSYYGKLERGERQPSLALLLRISMALGCSGAALMEQVEKALRAHKS